MNRSSLIGWMAVLALCGSCGVIGETKLDFSDPEVIIYTTRLGLAQTYDTVATGAEQGLVTKSQGISLRTRLDQATAALNVAESALRGDEDTKAREHTEQALHLLADVRKDPALQPLIAAGR